MAASSGILSPVKPARGWILYLFSASLLCIAVGATGDCPCDHVQWCEPVSGTAEKEIFIFALSAENWPKYDWNKTTTVVQFGNLKSDEMMCYAHSQGVKVVSAANFPVSNLTNIDDRQHWVKSVVDDVVARHLDGVNVDFESAIPASNTTQRKAFTSLIQELTSSMRDRQPNAQVTVDVAWSPDCIDDRCYDYKAIGDIVDFLFVMAYDERSQIYDDCVGWANSASNNTNYGMKRFLDLGLAADKLVLGIPWYGYNYPCLHLSKDTCEIKKVPFRGVACSDAAGRQMNYANILDLLNTSTTGRLWDNVAQSPYFTYKDATSGQFHQVWYDDPESLSIKYKFAVSNDLRGVGMWNADAVDYSDTQKGYENRHQMWHALPSY